MMISENLAQQIVETAMHAVHRNVNIMNRDGVIIATGHPHRKYTHHRGAQLVIETGTAVEIYPSELDRYPGALEGINLPIFFEGQIIGVIGVYGNPDEVRNIGHLIKMITELIIERELANRETRSRNQYSQQFIDLLLTAYTQDNTSKIKRMAKSLGFDHTIPRAVAVADLSSFLEQAAKQFGASEFIASHVTDTILEQIRISEITDEHDLAVILGEQLIVLKSFPPHGFIENGSAWIQKLASCLTQKQGHEVKCALGGIAHNLKDYAVSFRQAKYCLGLASAGRPAVFICEKDLLIRYMIAEVLAGLGGTAMIPYAEEFGKYIESRRDAEKTVAALLDQTLNISRAAEELDIHRNTLIFRLARLKEETGLDPVHRFEDALLCKILLTDHTTRKQRAGRADPLPL